MSKLTLFFCVSGKPETNRVDSTTKDAHVENTDFGDAWSDDNWEDLNVSLSFSLQISFFLIISCSSSGTLIGSCYVDSSFRFP